MNSNTFEHFARIGFQMHAVDTAYADGERPSTGSLKVQTTPVLKPEECRRLITQLSKLGSREGLVTSPTGAAVVDPDRYTAKEVLFNPAAASFTWLIRRLGHYIAEASRSAGRPELKKEEAARLVSYGQTGHFNWHPDSSAQVQRRLTLSLQLSPEATYSGGDLIILGQDGDWVCADRTQGAACLFPAPLFHRVMPVTHGRRSALVLWFY